jgi:hypothetical protein
MKILKSRLHMVDSEAYLYDGFFAAKYTRGTGEKTQGTGPVDPGLATPLMLFIIALSKGTIIEDRRCSIMVPLEFGIYIVIMRQMTICHGLVY